MFLTLPCWGLLQSYSQWWEILIVMPYNCDDILFVMLTGCIILWGEQDDLRYLGYLLCSFHVPLPPHQLCSHSDEVPYWSLRRNLSAIKCNINALTPNQLTLKFTGALIQELQCTLCFITALQCSVFWNQLRSIIIFLMWCLLFLSYYCIASMPTHKVAHVWAMTITSAWSTITTT